MLAAAAQQGDSVATLITVHGTFATGPLEGRAWWQYGSPFTMRLAMLLQADGDPITLAPFIWNGLNSEAARRAAGQELAVKLVALEGRGEPYAIIGHSHGGSVVGAALLESARAGNTLNNLQRWITVGTPFIKTERHRLLFSRLGIFGKAIYLTLLTFMVLVGLAVFVGADKREWPEWVIAVLCAFGPMAAFYAAMAIRQFRHGFSRASNTTGVAAETFGPRWLSLWHAKDEAVQSLKAVKKLDVEVFSRDFAAAALNLLAIAVIPIVCLLLLTSEPIMDTFSEQLFSRFDAITAEDIYTAGGHDIFENSAVVLLWLIVVPASLFISPTAFGKLSDLETLGLLVVSLVLLMGTAVCLTWIFNKAARIVSHGLSLALNPITVSQLKAAAYGSDMQEAFAVDTAEWPIWLSRGHPPLPAWIASDLEQASDHAISEVIPKFRNIIENLTEADSKQATADVLADYLTWKELIHTSYFDQDRFIKLVAYAIGQSRGFRSSPAFIIDHDYPHVARAYESIMQSSINDEPS